MSNDGSVDDGPADGRPTPNRAGSAFAFVARCAGEQARSEPWERGSADRIDRIDDIDGVSWTAVLRLAHRHRVRPLVYRHLETRNAGVPPDVLAEVEAACVAIGAHNLFALGEAAALLDRLADHGIRALTYKGPSLALLAYGDVAAREFADLDLLVPAADFSAAADVLRAGDYAVETAHPLVGESVFRERETDLPVDLHYTLTPTRYPFDFRFDRLWSRRVRVAASGETIRTLAPSDLVSVLAVHGTKHYWTRLEWIASLAALVRRQDVEWSRVLARSERVGCHRMVLLGLALARDLLGLTLPERVSRAIVEERGVTTMAERLADDVYSRDGGDVIDRRVFHRNRHALQLSLMCGLRAKGTYAVRVGRTVTARRLRRFVGPEPFER